MNRLKQILNYYWPVIILLVFFGLLFGDLLWTHMLQPGEDGWYSGGSTWADLAFHLTLISNFSQHPLKTISHDPIFIGKSLSYPFAPDLLTTLFWVKGHLPLRWALIGSSFIVTILVVWMIYFLSLKMTGPRASLLVPFLFLFNGSLFAVQYFWQDFKSSGQSLKQFMDHMPKDYTNLPDHGLYFMNIVNNFILPQRAFIFGLILGIPAIYFLWKYWLDRERINLFWAGLLISFLPVVHTHSFLTLIIASGFLFLIQTSGNLREFRQSIVDWIYFALPILMVALPQVILIFPHDKENFIRLYFGWSWTKDQGSFLWFWIKNLGLYLILIPLAYFYAPPKLKSFYLAFLGVFVVANLVVFQPYVWDNMKLMVWWFLLSVILVISLFDQLKTTWSRTLIIILLFMTMAPGGLAVYRERTLHWLMFSNEDIALAGYVKSSTDKDAVFLTSDKHNNPIPSLAGRQILMGYRGWLWSHGIDYKDREQDVIKIYEGNKGLINQYGIDYILIENDKTRDFHINQNFFQQNYKLVYKSPNYSLYSSGR